MNNKSNLESTWRRVGVAALLASALSVVAPTVVAGECPADKRVADGQGQKDAGHKAKGVTDVVRSSTDLSKEAPMLKDRLFRLRQLDIAPGGIVPFHSHDERPAQIYIVKGTIVEYATNCAVPITHMAGDVATEKRGVSHWWQNNTNEPVLLISVDILHDTAGADKKMM
ncbi:MAG: cupin domain-containing protein [Burkholderiaceae bacterium]